MRKTEKARWLGSSRLFFRGLRRSAAYNATLRVAALALLRVAALVLFKLLKDIFAVPTVLALTAAFAKGTRIEAIFSPLASLATLAFFAVLGADQGLFLD